MQKLNKWALLVALILLVVDQATKYWVQQHIPLMNYFALYPYGGFGVFKDFLGIEFSIVHATNKGMAWSLMSNYQGLLIGIRIALIAALIVFLLFRNHRPSWQFPLLLIISGAIGNVIDYFAYGHVIDMLHFVLWGYDYPVFNIADSSIFIGVIWLMFKARDSSK